MRKARLGVGKVWYRHSSNESDRTLLLNCALHHVPEHGWTEVSLAKGAIDAGYVY